MKKLVRDLIPEIIKKKGGTPSYFVASESEYKVELLTKLQEEVKEFAKDESIEEMADIMEVIYSICELKGYGFEEVEEIRKKKAMERGGFSKRIILENLTDTEYE